MNTRIKFFCLMLISSSVIQSMHSEKKRMYKPDNSIDSTLDVICDPCLYPFVGCCLGAYNKSSQFYRHIFANKQALSTLDFKAKKD